jgi:hypothetical protein
MMIKRMEEAGVAVYVAEIVNAWGMLVVKSKRTRLLGRSWHNMKISVK